MSFTTGSVRMSRRYLQSAANQLPIAAPWPEQLCVCSFIDACRIFKLTVSFGSVNSLCELVRALVFVQH